MGKTEKRGIVCWGKGRIEILVMKKKGDASVSIRSCWTLRMSEAMLGCPLKKGRREGGEYKGRYGLPSSIPV